MTQKKKRKRNELENKKKTEKKYINVPRTHLVH